MLLFNKILVPTDFSPCAERAFEYAMRLSTHGTEVALLHVFAFPYDWYYLDTAGAESLKNEVEEAARSKLQKLAAAHQKEGVEIKERFEINSHVIKATLAVIESESPGVVIMGTKGWSDKPLQLGSVAEQIARQSETPVLMVSDRAGRLSGSTKVLIPLAASESNAPALRLGEAIAHAWGGTVDVLHVLPDAPFDRPFLGDEPIEEGEMLESDQRLKRLEEFVAKHSRSRVPITVSLAQGEFAEAVDEFVEDESVGLVVMTRSDAENRPHKAELVAQEVDCPVLVVPTIALLPGSTQTATDATNPSLH